MASGVTASTSSCGGSRNLKHFIQRQWELAGQLVEKTQQLKQNGHIHGIQRIERKLSAERAFLESVRIATCLFVILINELPVLYHSYTVRTNYRFTYKSMVTIVRHYTEHNMLYEHAKEILCGEPMLGCLSMLERCKYGPHIVTGSE